MAESTTNAPDQAPSPRDKPCVICGKPAIPRHKPFCSPRCADIDLGRWLKGSYVIPGEPIDPAEADSLAIDRDDQS